MIALEQVSIRQGNFQLTELSLTVPAGAYAVLMGKTGCGKTTIIELLCGLRPIRSGRVLVGGRDVTGLPPGDRGLGYVPQDSALFPAMNVRAHLGFALKIRRHRPIDIATRVAELADRLGLTHLLDRRVQGLSGGERQRVALGRALAARPAALILDEPMAAVDEDTREHLCALLISITHEQPVTVLHVTHSRAEAERLADVRLHLRDGRVVAE